MAGLKNICKMYGSLKVTDKKGKSVMWLYDYEKDEPRLKSEMTKDEIKASERAKWTNKNETGKDI
jgi:major membrane immunogen (membrane-anchored lipoprotein)